MVKKIKKINGKSKIKAISKKTSKSKTHSKITSPKRVTSITKQDNNINAAAYKEGLMSANAQEEKYNKLFEEKLSEQYKEFRNIKEHHMQIKRFLGMLIVILTVIVLALLILTFG
jgi:hypothetical protein